MARHRLSLRTALLLVGSLALAGCSREGVPPPGPEAPPPGGEVSPSSPGAEGGEALAAAPDPSGDSTARSAGPTGDAAERPVPRPPRPAPSEDDTGRPPPREHSREDLEEAPPDSPPPATLSGTGRSRETATLAEGGLVSVPAGTRIKVVLATRLSSRETRAGDSFEARPLHDLWVDEVRIPLQEGTILGRVSLVARPDEDEGRPGILSLDFQTLRTASSEEYALPGKVTGEAAVGLLRALPGQHVELSPGTGLVIVLTANALLPPA